MQQKNRSVHVYKYQFLISIMLQLMPAFLEVKAFISIVVPLHYLGSFSKSATSSKILKDADLQK